MPYGFPHRAEIVCKITEFSSIWAIYASAGVIILNKLTIITMIRKSAPPTIPWPYRRGLEWDADMQVRIIHIIHTRTNMQIWVLTRDATELSQEHQVCCCRLLSFSVCDTNGSDSGYAFSFNFHLVVVFLSHLEVYIKSHFPFHLCQ